MGQNAFHLRTEIIVGHGHVKLRAPLQGNQLLNVPDGNHLLAQAHKDQISRVLPAIALALGPGDYALARIVAHHGGGDPLFPVRAHQGSQRLFHQRDQLVNVQAKIRQIRIARQAKGLDLPAKGGLLEPFHALPSSIRTVVSS